MAMAIVTEGYGRDAVVVQKKNRTTYKRSKDSKRGSRKTRKREKEFAMLVCLFAYVVVGLLQCIKTM